MKKLFGKNKTSQSQAGYSTRPTPFAVEDRPNTPNDKWQLIQPPGGQGDYDDVLDQQLLPSPHSPRASNHNIPNINPNLKRKNPASPPPAQSAAVGALGILRALDPPQMTVEPFALPPLNDVQAQKKHIWDKKPVHPKLAGQPLDSGEGELTRMIGYLTATASDDWPLLLEVCDRASISEHNAKEAVRALRREFRYGGSAGQMAATRLFALFLRKSSSVVVSQLTSRKFLDTIEELIFSPRTLPVVRERIIEVIAAAAYASQSSKREKDGFRGLWKKVKPQDMPDEGFPFNVSDSMVNPPNSYPQQPPLQQHAGATPTANATATTPFPQSQSDDQRRPSYELQQPPYPLPVGVDEPPPPSSRKHHGRHDKHAGGGGDPNVKSRNRIIPPDEDMRRLLQECKIAIGNASLLESALAHTDVGTAAEDDIVKEFLVKCQTSQDLIYAQIPWASAQAEKSRLARDVEIKNQMTKGASFVTDPAEKTPEENLLEAILQANENLVEVLQQYADIERCRMDERKKAVRNRNQPQQQQQQHQPQQHLNVNGITRGGGGGDPPPSPPATNLSYRHGHHPHQYYRQRSRSPSVSSDISQSHSQHYAQHDQHGGGGGPPQTQMTHAPLSHQQQQRLFGPRGGVPPAPMGPRPSVETDREGVVVVGGGGGNERDDYIWVAPGPPPPLLNSGRRHGGGGGSSEGSLGSRMEVELRVHVHVEEEQGMGVDVEEEEEYSENAPVVPSEKARGKMRVVDLLGHGEDGNSLLHGGVGGVNGHHEGGGSSGGGGAAGGGKVEKGVYLNGHGRSNNNSTHSFESLPASLRPPPPPSHRSSGEFSNDSESESERWKKKKKKKNEFVYDAAAERTKEMLRTLRLEAEDG